MQDFGILAWPAYLNKAGNPYNFLIYSNIEAKGFPVYEFSLDSKTVLKYCIFSKYKILHLHWPISNVLSVSRYLQAYRRLVTFYSFIIILKLLNKKIVWTVHNMEEHESTYPVLQTRLNNFLYKYVDGFISLNKSGVKIIKRKVFNIERQKVFYIPHPHYKGYYKNLMNKDLVRKKLGIGEDKFVFLFLGQIRKYKNVTGLIEAFKQLKDKNSILLIAGALHEELAGELKEHLTNCEDIKLYNSFVKDDDLQIFLNAADLVVTPYNKIFNSGSVFLNLSFNKPTLVPDVESLTELKNMVGPHWIKSFSGPINAEILMQAAEEVKNESKEVSIPDLNSFDTERIANDTIACYRALLFEK